MMGTGKPVNLRRYILARWVVEGIVDVEDVLREIQAILEDRVARWLGGRSKGVLLTVDFVTELINLSAVDLDPAERAALERVFKTRIL